jgi:hypothetical protein
MVFMLAKASTGRSPRAHSTKLCWVTELFHAKKVYHRVKEHLESHLWYLAALINCLLRITEHKRSLAEFVI